MKKLFVLLLIIGVYSSLHPSAAFSEDEHFPSETTYNKPNMQTGQPGQAGPEPVWRSYPEQRQLSQPRPSAPSKPAGAEPSQFELYIAKKAVDITITQLEIVSRLYDIDFTYTKERLPADKMAIAVMVVEPPAETIAVYDGKTREDAVPAKPKVVDAGYLIGSLEAITSAFEMLGIKSTAVVTSDIRQFGYDLFLRSPESFDPADILPVAPDYLLGPNDEIRLSVWGKVNAEYNFVLDRDGNIVVPRMGVMHLAGLTFAEAKSYIDNEFSRYFRPTEVMVNISLGRLRTITVFVVGKLERPGSYTVSSFSTIINALIAAGGPSKSGSLRNIQLKRNGETVAELDMYDFLLKGDKTKDARLMPGDVVFVPPVGPLAGVAGSVRAPAIYELKGGEGVLEIIGMAGGTTGIAYNNRVQLSRVTAAGEQDLVESDLSGIEKGLAEDFKLKDGDLVTIFPASGIVEGIVHVAGAVKAPGTFGFKPGMKLGELVNYAGGVLRYTDTEKAELTRVHITSCGPVTERLTVNLGKALAGDPGENIPLKEDDYLFVRTVPEWELYRVVTVEGDVLYPGEYTIQKGETLSSLVERAGGYTDKAYIKGAVFTRESVRESQQKNLNELIDRLEGQLLSSSAVSIETSLTPEAAQQEKVAAEQRKAFIAKLKMARAKGRISLRLTEMEEFKGGPYDIVLEDGDKLVVPERPSHVQVLGSVYNQTAFVFDERRELDDYLYMAGGMTKDADEDEMYILKVDGTAVSKRTSEGFLGFNYDPERHSWSSGGFTSRRLDPGDTVVVPAETEKIAWLREVKDITQILFQIAVSAGVIIAAF